MNNREGEKALLSALSANICAEELQLCTLQGLVAGGISTRRQELHMSQKQFADAMGVSQGLVSKWESGETNFTLSTLVSIASKLGLDMQPPIVPAPPKYSSVAGGDIVQYCPNRSWYSISSKPPKPGFSNISSEFELEEM